MQIFEEVREDVIILKVSGQMTIRSDVDMLRDQIRSLAGFGINKLVVDFSQVDWFGSSMISVLTEGLTLIRESGGDLRLTGVGRRIERVLTVTGLEGIFRIFNGIDEGVESFQDEDVHTGERVVSLAQTARCSTGTDGNFFLC